MSDDGWFGYGTIAFVFSIPFFCWCVCGLDCLGLTVRKMGIVRTVLKPVHCKTMRLPTLNLVSPAIVNRTVMPGGRPNAELKTREYITEAEIERLMRAAGKNRYGRDFGDQETDHPIRHWLTRLGVLTGHVGAFAIVPLYGLAWLLFAP